MSHNPFGFYEEQDCNICNSTGKILVLDEFENEQEKDCSHCDGKGFLKIYV